MYFTLSNGTPSKGHTRGTQRGRKGRNRDKKSTGKKKGMWKRQTSGRKDERVEKSKKNKKTSTNVYSENNMTWAHPVIYSAVLFHSRSQIPMYTLFIVYSEEKPWCLNSFGIKFELNKSADLPLRQHMPYKEHWAIKQGGQRHCWEITQGGLWFGLGLTREKREGRVG